jgi:hypothetical protein
MNLKVLQVSVAMASCFAWCVLTLPALGQAHEPDLPIPGNHSAAAGDCPKCKSGEFGTTVEKWVDHGDYVYVPNPPCSSSVSDDVKKIGRTLADNALPGLSQAAGGIVDDITAKAVKFIGSQARGTIGEILSRYTNPQAQCELVCAVIPQNATYNNSISLLAGDGDRGAGACTLDANGDIPCSVGWSKWQQPKHEQNEATQLVCSVFMNWSHDRARWASMTVFYTMPPGQHPLELR